MFPRTSIAKLIVTGLLMVSIGLPWMFLQSVAWLGMAVTFTVEKGSLAEGLSATFDGGHPCVLCKAVETGSKETPESAPFKAFKLEAVLAGVPRLVAPAGVFFEHPEWRGCLAAGMDDERLRPPRSGPGRV